MKCRKLLLVAAGLAIFVSGDSLADNVKVIANASVTADAISAAVGQSTPLPTTDTSPPATG